MLSELPSENSATVPRLHAIEVVLREFIIESAHEAWGPHWWKQKMLGDVKEQARDRMEREKSHRWNQIVLHHPIYYTDFPHLKKIAENSQFWAGCFRQHFGNNSSQLTVRLAGLEPIRNKVAHHRRATSQDVSIVCASFDIISGALGLAYFQDLSARCTAANDLQDVVKQLLEDARLSWNSISQYQSLSATPAWHVVRRSWWFDSDYLGHDIAPVMEYFRLLRTYHEFPRLPGSGHRLETWTREHHLEDRYAAAVGTLDAILKDSAR